MSWSSNFHFLSVYKCILILVTFFHEVFRKMNAILRQIGPIVGPHNLFMRLNEPDNSIKLNEHHFQEKVCRKLIFVLHGGWMKTLFKKMDPLHWLSISKKGRNDSICHSERQPLLVSEIRFSKAFLSDFGTRYVELTRQKLLKSFRFRPQPDKFHAQTTVILGAETLSVLFPRNKNISKIGLKKNLAYIFESRNKMLNCSKNNWFLNWKN